MLIIYFLFVFIFNCFFVCNSYAINYHTNNNLGIHKNQNPILLYASDNKRKREIEEGKENIPNKRHKNTHTKQESLNNDHSFPQDSPRTRERKALSPYRRRLISYLYKNLTGKKGTVSSPIVRDIFKHDSLLQYFTRCCMVNGKTVYQADFLFDPSAKVYTDGKWITNLKRMKMGKAPIGYSGIISEQERTALTPQEITKRQKLYSIELHHFTQKDTNTDADPIGEATHDAHMGRTKRYIIKIDDKTREVYIVHSNLEKEEARKLCGPNQFIVSNVLHFRKGRSLINRDEFNDWRKAYWERRAIGIEQAMSRKKLNKPEACRKLFF